MPRRPPSSTRPAHGFAPAGTGLLLALCLALSASALARMVAPPDHPAAPRPDTATPQPPAPAAADPRTTAPSPRR